MTGQSPERGIAPPLLRALSEALVRWQVQLPRGHVPASIYKELLLPHRSRAPDLAWEADAARARAIAEPALRAILEPLIAGHFRAGQRVLEVGAGTLHGGRSYLTRYFDPGPALEWTFADSREVVRRWGNTAAGARCRELELVPGTEPPEGDAAFDHVVASNVFDTLPYGDFGAALGTIARWVGRGGQLLHVADLNFYLNAFLDACGQPGLVLFPSVASHKLIHAMSKDRYAEVVDRTRPNLSADEADFFAAWGEQAPQIHAVVIGDAILTGMDLPSMARRVESLFAGHLQPLQQVGLFQRSLCASAARTGWQVIECGFRVAQVMIPRRGILQGTFNRHELDEGVVNGRCDPTVPAGVERVRAKLHVFLARRS